MEILIGRIKEGNRGLYRITYNNGYIYVGSFVNSKRHIIGESYFGSSGVALHYNWRKSNSIQNSDYNKSQIKLLEIWYLRENIEIKQTLLESRFIRLNYLKYGVAECAKVLLYSSTLEKYKIGRMINLHANSNLHLSSPEIRRKVVSKINYDELRLKLIEKYGYDPFNGPEATIKALKTRFKKYGYYFTEEARMKAREAASLNGKESIKRLDTPEARKKSINVRRVKGYREASLKVAESIK